MTDDGGVLGNLPRSRPGRRSEKRDAGGGAAGTSAKAASRAERSGAKAAEPAKDATRTRRRPPEPAPARGGDPVGDALRTVTGLAASGARVANGVARGVLRRLPRP